MLLRGGRPAEAREAFAAAREKARTPDEERWFDARMAACEQNGDVPRWRSG
jgi:hypothetical protein